VVIVIEPASLGVWQAALRRQIASAPDKAICGALRNGGQHLTADRRSSSFVRHFMVTVHLTVFLQTAVAEASDRRGGQTLPGGASRLDSGQGRGLGAVRSGMLTETILEHDAWQAVDLTALAERAAWATLAELGLPPEGFAISLLACDDARIAALNADFRGKPQPTNVLSWPSEDRAPDRPGGLPVPPDPGPPGDPAELGDIAIAWETCRAEAAAAGKPLGDHLSHLIVHSVLHLLGYDHISDTDAEIMEAAEVRALARIGLADPY
jgi:probable rRNA maturation factor